MGNAQGIGPGSMGRRNAIKKALKLGGAAYVAPAVLSTVIPAMAVGAVTAPVAMAIITPVNPGTGPTTGGTTVVITGSGFVPGSTVLFGDTPLTGVTIVNGTTITGMTPPGTAGPVPVTIITPGGGSFTLTNGFTYTPGGGGGTAPTIGTINPNNGPTTGGTGVTITGTNFTPGATVVIGGAPATGVTVVNPTTITATTPPGTAGGAPVTVTTPNGTGTGTFTFRTVTPAGEAFAVNSSVLGLLNVNKVGDQLLPPGGSNTVANVNAPGVLTTGAVTDSALNISNATPGNVTAQSTSTVANVNLLAGALTATVVSAQSTSTSNGTAASSTAAFTGTVAIGGQTFNLATTLPNTVVNIPGVANVTLNRVVTTTAGANSNQTATAISVQLLGLLLNGVTLDIATAISSVITT